MTKQYTPPDGWVMQAFQFALDPNGEQRQIIARQFGGRRFAYNWVVATLKADLDAYRETGVETERPSHYGLRKRWNTEKGSCCVNRETGEIWWPEVSKEVYSAAIREAVDAYWRWQGSRAGRVAGRRVGFPKFKRKGRDADRFSVEMVRLIDRRHVQIPKVGRVRLHENARRLERLVASGRARVLAGTVRRSGGRLLVSLRVEVRRPQANTKPSNPASSVGVDVGVRTLATVANTDGLVLERVGNPAPLDKALSDLRRLNRSKSRRAPGSRQHRDVTQRISELHAKIKNIRQHNVHVFTTRLAKTHGRIVVEGLDAASLMQQKGLTGARARRRGLADAAIAEPRRQLRYKTVWYGSELVEADKWFPSSKTCHGCGHVQVIGWAERWTCDNCGAEHQRDDNAAINLARWSGDVGTVGAPVKCGADHKTGPRPAGGEDTRKSPQSDNPARGAEQLTLLLL